MDGYILIRFNALVHYKSIDVAAVAEPLFMGLLPDT